MTNKQSWGVRETVDKIFEAMGQYGGCDGLSLAKAEEIIKELLTSKSEQMEREIQSILGKYLSKVDEDGEQYDPTDIILVKISHEIRDILKK